MIEIYKGTKYELPIESTFNNITGARLYNLATRTVVEMALSTPVYDGEAIYTYKATMTPNETAKIPQGIYNLEVYSGQVVNNDVVIIAKYTNYAKVTESSFTQEYA